LWAAAAQDVSSIDKAVRDAAAQNETRLIATNKVRNVGLQPSSENLRDCFDGGVLQSYRPEILGLSGGIFLWKENKVGAIQPLDVSVEGVERVKECEESGGGGGPGGSVEEGAKPIRPRTSVGMHMANGSVNFIRLERSSKVIKGKVIIDIQVVNTEGPVSGMRSAKELGVEGVKNHRFLIMIAKLTVVVLNDLNFIAAMTLIGASMEVTSVFIPLEGSSHFAALLPKHKFSLGRSAKDVDNKCTKLMLRRRKDP
jgi:hypothetical protein